ncbi:MAG: DUF1343 domain-containing protein [Candidatus Neomarinimicrobiota bacterium]
MTIHLFHLFTAILILTGLSRSQDFENSSVTSVPELEFYPGVFTGLDVLQEMQFKPLSGLNLAILTNQTSVNREGIHLLDLLASRGEEIQVEVIFTPQHGFLANATQEVTVAEAGYESFHGAPVRRLWGGEMRPKINDLAKVDLILVDFQDPGTRFFSFMTTATKVMEIAAFLDIAVMVLDRPNPMNGIVIDGPIVRSQYQSYLGYHLVPIRHGLTVGEYSIMINESGWIRQGDRVALNVVPMVNWKREMWMDETGIPWVHVATNIPDLTTLLAYMGMGLIEGTNLSCGVGTDSPYLLVGAPWIREKIIVESLRRKGLEGVEFSPAVFNPDSLSTIVSRPRYRGEKCGGVRILITDREKFSPILTAATILSVVSAHYPRRFRWEDEAYVDKLYGHDYLRIFLAQERDPFKLPATWSHDVMKFSQFRKKFLLY